MGLRDPIDLDALAAQAQRKGVDSPDAVAEYLRSIIERNADYLHYRRERGRGGVYNEQVARDNEALARAVQFLERGGATFDDDPKPWKSPLMASLRRRNFKDRARRRGDIDEEDWL